MRRYEHADAELHAEVVRQSPRRRRSPTASASRTGCSTAPEDLLRGQRRRVEAGAHPSRVPRRCLLDEPTNHLDADSIVAAYDFLKRIRRAVVISHDTGLLGRP